MPGIAGSAFQSVSPTNRLIPRSITVYPSYDQTGKTDLANINAAALALGHFGTSSQTGSGGGIIQLDAAPYFVNSTIYLPIAVSIRGPMPLQRRDYNPTGNTPSVAGVCSIIPETPFLDASKDLIHAGGTVSGYVSRESVVENIELWPPSSSTGAIVHMTSNDKCTVRNCILKGTMNNGILWDVNVITGGGEGGFGRIYNNVISACNGIGIYQDFQTQNLIYRNFFENPAPGAIGIALNRSNVCSVSDNLMQGFNNNSGTTIAIAIQQIGNAQSFLISILGNHIQLGGTGTNYGLYLSGKLNTSIKVQGNAFFGGLATAIHVDTLNPPNVKSAYEFRANPGYNPQGFNINQDAIPASGVEWVNDLYSDVNNIITGVGTGISQAIITDGFGNAFTWPAAVAVGTVFKVPYNGGLTLTYTGTPTWEIYGD
jgi:hypothetical protein